MSREDDLLVLDFPADPPEPCATPDAIPAAFGLGDVECLVAEDLVVVFEDARAVRSATR